jgi:hypothetical protein
MNKKTIEAQSPCCDGCVNALLRLRPEAASAGNHRKFAVSCDYGDQEER